MMAIIVCSLDRVAEAAARPSVTHVASLVRLPLAHKTALEQHFGAHQTRLLLEFDDIVYPIEGQCAPSRAAIERLITFVRGWRQRGDILFHCWYGVSRSTAAAIIAMHAVLGWSPGAIARRIVAAMPFAAPNPLMLALADEVLGCAGRLRAIADECRGDRSFLDGHLTMVSFEREEAWSG